MPKKELGGRMRIGIVLSVVWFVGFGAYIWVSEIGPRMHSYQFQLKTCVQILNMANDALQDVQNQNDRDKRQAANWARYEKCQGKATMFLNREIDNVYRTIPIFLAVDFGIILVFWLLAWFAAPIRHLIKRGFAT
jgi:hypothetical protein